MLHNKSNDSIPLKSILRITKNSPPAVTFIRVKLQFFVRPLNQTLSVPLVAMYREPSLHDVAEQSPPRKTPKTSSDSPVHQNGKKDAQSKTKTSSS